MERGSLIRGAQGAVLAGVSALVLSACGETMPGDLEYGTDGTASRPHYEAIEDENHGPTKKGDLEFTRSFACEEDTYAIVRWTDRKPDGQVVGEGSRSSRACRDGKITDPEIP